MMRLTLLLVPALLFALSAAVFADEAGKTEEKPKSDKPAESEKKPEEKKEEKPAEEKAPDVATIDKKAPDFTLKNAKGEEVKLSSFADKYVILEWINFDCAFVRKHYDGGAMNATRKKYAEKGVVWLQICSSAKGKEGYFEGEDLTKRIEKESCDAAFYLVDSDGKVGKSYQAKTTPAMYVIDKKGILRYMGAIDSVKSAKKEDVEGATNYVSAAMDELLADKAVSTKETKSYG
jgi:peroxiredoxin